MKTWHITDRNLLYFIQKSTIYMTKNEMDWKWIFHIVSIDENRCRKYCKFILSKDRYMSKITCKLIHTSISFVWVHIWNLFFWFYTNNVVNIQQQKYECLFSQPCSYLLLWISEISMIVKISTTSKIKFDLFWFSLEGCLILPYF